jgi:Acetyltransferase (GNAT) domain
LGYGAPGNARLARLGAGMITVAEETTIDFESTARIATEAFGAKDVKFFPERMKWLYERGFGQGSAVVAAFDGDKKVGQIVLLHQKAYLDGRPVVATQLIDLFILQAYRSPTLVRRIYKEVERLCEAGHVRIVLALPNENSASLNARLLKLRPFLALPARAGISLGRPSRSHLTFSGRLKALPRSEAIGLLAGFATPVTENGLHWDAETLLDRISDPTCDYAVHVTANLLLVSSARKTRGISHVLLCGFFARPQSTITASDASDVIRAACRFWKRPIFVYAGINKSLPRLPGFPIPARYRQPILVQLRDLSSDGDELRFDRYQLTDSDFV